MRRCYLFTFIFLAASLAPCAFGQTLFRVYPSATVTAEGGAKPVLLIETDNRKFCIGVPVHYGSQAHLETDSIVFTSASGSSVMTIRFSTNYSGTLPPQDTLRDTVAANHSGASLVKSADCYTDFGRGQDFELFQPTRDGLMLKLRDAYVSYPEGSVEFTLSSNATDYDHEKRIFARLLNSFRCMPEDAKKNL
jgi:hypothetical protein